MPLDPIDLGAAPYGFGGDNPREALAKAKASLEGLFGGANVFDETLKGWAEAGAFEVTAVTLDADQVPTTATVKWPDGSAGTFTTTTKNTTWLAVDAFTLAHADSGKTVVQAAVTRDANGNVTAKPVLTVT